MAIPKEKNRATQVTVAVIVGVAFWMPFRGLWGLAVDNHLAMWLAVPSSIALAIAFDYWYGYMQSKP